MNRLRPPICAIALAVASFAAFAQGPAPAAYGFERGYPTTETSVRARDDADFQRAMTAYRYWYPTVSVEGIFNGNRSLGIEDGKAWGIAAASPRQIGLTLNSDTP